ncbi:FAD-dependent oxidoreductase [Salinirubrum litoreum]|uniref:FAD-dependent oxidoreductase n=1 Tax=Salinirubrum litoreum TaxID=1126234 RepID=A0ABD5RBH5_9EURY|nr:FAD-dependent oxidoreductase [Salinirubrum litoreum]
MTPEHDVVVVGGGPAGCAVGVFTARAGLDTLLFDRGRSSIARCAHLENYLGFPAGVDAETFAELCHDHAETAGCVIEPNLVESVERVDAPAETGEAADTEEPHFRVRPQSGDPVTASRVVTATRYDADYLRDLDAAADLFTDPSDDAQLRDDCAAHDGTTPVDGLYVVSPSPEDTQAMIAAGRGARVGRRVVADARIDDGWWEAVATERVDWTRRTAELDAEWADRARWVEWFDDHHADAPVDTDSERYRRVRARAIAEARDSYIDTNEETTRAEDGQARLAEHLDPAAAVDGIGADRLLDAMDDAAIRAYLDRETVVGD